MRKRFIAGNWKMFKTLPEGEKLIKTLVRKFGKNATVDVALCPPFTHLDMAVRLTELSPIKIGAQDIAVREEGAFTGEVSAPMVKSLDVQYVIIGHSERRRYHHERDALLNMKMRIALNHGLDVIYCVGESLTEREIGLTNEVVINQVELGLRKIATEALPRVTIAYEPIWAIGTGKTASPKQAQETHKFIRTWMSDFYGEDMANTVRIIYGGSVKPANAERLFNQPDIDGALVGGACLDTDSFMAIINAGQKKKSRK